MRTRLYYQFKPLVPRPLRLAVHGWLVRRTRRHTREFWPVLPGSGKRPGWPGWPDGKEFAIVLTHDVESQSGLDKCRQLMELEEKWGFRSSFNFIPEGDYRVTKELRDELTAAGFEVGVHDLYHDGKLYRDRKKFVAKAVLINEHLAAWGAVGFRSGFMFHNLNWLEDLNIEYDASTFDTDPFEPQPDGVGTVFPFWCEGARGRGFVELPYTLPQDSTLFLLMRERNPEIWLRKLDWIARQGGMVLMNVHPDYVDFSGGNGNWKTFPAAFYEQFLEYARSKYGGHFWEGTPRQVADYVRSSRGAG